MAAQACTAAALHHHAATSTSRGQRSQRKGALHAARAAKDVAQREARAHAAVALGNADALREGMGSSGVGQQQQLRSRAAGQQGSRAGQAGLALPPAEPQQRPGILRRPGAPLCACCAPPPPSLRPSCSARALDSTPSTHLERHDAPLVLRHRQLQLNDVARPKLGPLQLQRHRRLALLLQRLHNMWVRRRGGKLGWGCCVPSRRVRLCCMRQAAGSQAPSELPPAAASPLQARPPAPLTVSRCCMRLGRALRFCSSRVGVHGAGAAAAAAAAAAAGACCAALGAAACAAHDCCVKPLRLTRLTSVRVEASSCAAGAAMLLLGPAQARTLRAARASAWRSIAALLGAGRRGWQGGKAGGGAGRAWGSNRDQGSEDAHDGEQGRLMQACHAAHDLPRGNAAAVAAVDGVPGGTARRLHAITPASRSFVSPSRCPERGRRPVARGQC